MATTQLLNPQVNGIVVFVVVVVSIAVRVANGHREFAILLTPTGWVKGHAPQK